MKYETKIQLILIPMGIILFWLGLYIVDLFEDIYIRTPLLIIPIIGILMFLIPSMNLLKLNQ